MRSARSARNSGALVLALIAYASSSHAHPAGTASINRSIDFTYVGDGHFRVAYALDFAEGPAYAEIEALDANHDGAVTADEQRTYLDARLSPLIAAWVVEVDGVRVTPSVVASHVDVAPGQGGQDTVRIDSEVSVVAPWAGGDIRLHVRDDAFADSPGWRTIFARSEGSAWGKDLADAATSLHVSDARFVLHSGASRGSVRVVVVAACALMLGALLAARLLRAR